MTLCFYCRRWRPPAWIMARRDAPRSLPHCEEAFSLWVATVISAVRHLPPSELNPINLVNNLSALEDEYSPPISNLKAPIKGAESKPPNHRARDSTLPLRPPHPRPSPRVSQRGHTQCQRIYERLDTLALVREYRKDRVCVAGL